MRGSAFLHTLAIVQRAMQTASVRVEVKMKKKRPELGFAIDFLRFVASLAF